MILSARMLSLNARHGLLCKNLRDSCLKRASSSSGCGTSSGALPSFRSNVLSFLVMALSWARHNLWCQSRFRPRHSVSSRSVQDSAARSSGPYLAALPLLPRLGALVGSGGAVGCRDGALGVVGVEGDGGASGFISVTPGLFGTRSSYQRR
jgi:hypothetical protein